VIVTDGEQRSALAVVRSLGAAGYRCVVTSSSGASIAGGSRFVSRIAIVPNALEQPSEFADAIVAVAAAERAAVVLPISDQSLLAILPVRARLSPAVVPFPDLAAFSALADKERLLEEASKLGIAIPAQKIVRDLDVFASMDLSGLHYPVVLKPARSVSERAGVRSAFSVTYASNASELQRKVRALPLAAFPLLLQRRVVGPGTGIFLLLWNGELKAQFAHQRLSEKPPSGGVSVYCESVSIDEELRDRSRVLLDRLGWCGVAMVEYKRDSVTGQSYLMEVNGRFWGSLQLAVDSGVDFPRILVACALGEHTEPMPSYHLGVRSRWWWGQIDHLVARVRGSATSNPLPPDARRFRRVVGDLLAGPFRRTDHEEVFWWTDPGPFWNETIGRIGPHALARRLGIELAGAKKVIARSLERSQGGRTRPSMTAMPRLRIAIMLESDGPGGAEMMVFRLAEELRRRGHTVLPVGPAHGIGWLGDHFRRLGFTPEVFRLRRPIDPGCVRGLMELFREHGIDVVHSHEFTMAVYGAAASRLLNLPHVITMHGGFKVTKALRRRIALRWAMRQSDHTVMVSRATRHQFATELGVDESLFTVVPNGVPVQTGDASRVRVEFGITERDCVLLAVGVLERHKGHRILLEALARLDSSGLNTPWKLIIAGGRGGDQHEWMLEYIRTAGLSERVYIVLDRNDIPDLLALADVFVMPSLWEGLPMAILEAMVARKAIVASAVAGIPEAIVDGREGLLVPPGEVAPLADALRLVIVDPARRRTLGEAAAARASRDFTIAVMAERYEGLYAKTYSKRHRTALTAQAELAVQAGPGSR
jgi:glycosyltransferase involved in cell wall biosynthesis/predicted ATP-grasp superfamily ATP-dependent carboligase